MDPWGLAFINEIEDNTAEKVKQIVFVIDIPSVVSLTDLYIWAVIARSVNDEAILT